MRTIKQQIKSLLESPVITSEILAKIDKLLGIAKPATTTAPRPKQPLDDAKAIATLKATIATLTAQINPAKATEAPEQDHEKLLDDLYQLQLKRAQEITQKGLDVNLGASAKPFKCLKVNESTVYFLSGTAVSPSTHIKQHGGLFGIITSVTPQSGRLKCAIWSPKHTSQTFQKSATASGASNFKAIGIAEPCQHTGDTVTFYNKYFAAGTILKLQGSFFEVVGSYQDQSLVVHKIKAFVEEQKQAQAIPRRGEDTSDMPKGRSLYWSKFIN